jgi:hypothetical protein
VRAFKITDNQSPQPQDRVFFSFNYFDNINARLNRDFEAPVKDLQVYREVFGLEKTFDQGYGSIGLRFPLNTLSASSALEGNFKKQGGTSTSVGDLTVFSKYVLKVDPATGSLVSAGLAITPPTGPNNFAGAHFVSNVHSTSIQPFLGYILNRGNFYLQGFCALDTPTSVRDVTLIYNDIGIGYFLMRDPNPDRFLTAVAPTFEVHVNTPLTHRDAFNANDPAGTADSVNFTYGINTEFFRRGILSFGLVTPVTGPRPFDLEALVLFNIRFGAGVIRRPPPPL